MNVPISGIPLSSLILESLILYSNKILGCFNFAAFINLENSYWKFSLHLSETQNKAKDSDPKSVSFHLDEETLIPLTSNLSNLQKRIKVSFPPFLSKCFKLSYLKKYEADLHILCSLRNVMLAGFWSNSVSNRTHYCILIL